jgi:hypothetical protein
VLLDYAFLGFILVIHALGMNNYKIIFDACKNRIPGHEISYTEKAFLQLIFPYLSASDAG